jgi:glycosyltransferase involved in cell wall biosynthesis
MKPLVSIITLAYNHEEFIEHCIRSVLNQGFKNWEMIIIDDASSDKTHEIASCFPKKDKRIKIIRHKTNWGIERLKDLYNYALNQAKGKLIAILEADDFWPKEKLEKQIRAFRSKNVVLSYGNWALVNQSGKIVYIRNYKKFNRKLLNNHPISSILNLFLTLQFDIGSQAVLIRKKTLLEVGGFNSNKYYPFVDIPTYLQLSLKGEFNYIPQLLGYYRRTRSSSWFNFAYQSSSMGRKEIKDCINNFISTSAQEFSNALQWNMIEKKQNQYLLIRKLFYLPSIIFHKLLLQ